MGRLFVIIVNYRTAPLTVQCLASLAPEVPALRGGRVIVVDNASGDDSLANVGAAIERRGWAGWAELIALPRNGGFAYGNNAAVRRVRELDANFAAVVLLNPDTIIRPGAIACLAAFLDSNAEVGIAGALIEDPNGRPELSAHPDPSPLGELVAAAQLRLLERWLPRHAARPPSSFPHASDWVTGACMAVRREVLDAVGPLDEQYFLYFEEVDYCVRARRQGWSCWFVPGARVVHFEGASTGIQLARRRRPAYWFDSRRRFFVKRYGVFGLLAADLLWGIGRLSLVLRRFLGLGGRSNLHAEPARIAFDLLKGDLKALLSGELRAIRRSS